MSNYFVIGPDGQKYGPATVDVLRDWAAQNRINNLTMLEDVDTGTRIMATTVPGLQLAPPQPTTEYPRGAPTYPSVPNNLILAIFSAVCCCQPFGIAAIVFASQVDGHWRRGDYNKAQDSAKKAKTFALLAIFLGGFLQIIWIIFSFLSESKRF